MRELVSRQPGCRALFMRLTKCSPEKGRLWREPKPCKHCVCSAGRGEQQLGYGHLNLLSGKEETCPKSEVEAHFLVLSQTTRITKYVSHCVFLVSMPESF